MPDLLKQLAGASGWCAIPKLTIDPSKTVWCQLLVWVWPASVRVSSFSGSGDHSPVQPSGEPRCGISHRLMRWLTVVSGPRGRPDETFAESL